MATGYRPEIVQRAFVDFIGSRLHPFRSLTTPKLRLVARYELSDDLIALRFETNRAFRQQTNGAKSGWQGGQYIDLRVLIDGIYHQRSYSLVGLANRPLWWHDAIVDSAPIKSKRHTVTIAIKAQGMVSRYLTKHLPIGATINTSVPRGHFTLAQSLMTAQREASNREHSDKDNFQKNTLLFIAGGSGITPMLGLITQALNNQHQVVLLHYNRTELASFTQQWQQLHAAYPNSFRYHLINTEDQNSYLSGSRHLTTDSLLSLNLPWADTQIFACGSQALLVGLYQAATDITLPQGRYLRDSITIENFGSALADISFDRHQTGDKAINVQEHTIYLRARQRQFSSDTTLLAAAERENIRLAYGCRQGVCQLCRCNKVSGVVKNIQTGRLSGDGYEPIQTCINIAMTDVVLDI
ncbi:iron-sulfur cluster-binding domain-containing protein [Psychrobacter sp. NG254]|uniref:flavin reductase family protein n=1 Tax=Psychrobacter sp. NG254 TaxID=2782003 RepID=UPI0018870F4A|nr:iron-sulfur cluster-binding domain-containing protein [Psychrobacter sp. NG254]MBF2719004.1 iron-sulfur cluster-binding domain-containing protein [Psychrobacter sp. NG254]